MVTVTSPNFSAALRIWLDDSTVSVRSCTVATYLLGEGINSRVLHLCEFSTVFYDLIFYSNLFQCGLKDPARQQHRECLFLYSSYILAVGMPLFGSELKFEPNLLELDRKSGSKFGFLLTRT